MNEPLMFHEQISSEDELRAIVDYPSEFVANKTISLLDDHCKMFIAKSPFLVMATSDKNGLCSVTPRGDEQGFVLIVDDYHLVIPERPGNRRIDSMRNIISNPHVGLLFVIPGLEETLRVNGRACITRDPALLERMQAKGKTPLLGIGIKVEQCFIHCAKAFKRSGLWNGKSWLSKDDLPNIARILAAHANLPGVTENEVTGYLHESYTQRLY